MAVNSDNFEFRTKVDNRENYYNTITLTKSGIKNSGFSLQNSNLFVHVLIDRVNILNVLPKCVLAPPYHPEKLPISI